ncbi:hypothetical protein BDD12DRAFT_912796 [Trichophaea hybrida]|nr:hypothetical protein BDD12DRAFT_912796 [Trichophaea hybrida]
MKNKDFQEIVFLTPLVSGVVTDECTCCSVVNHLPQWNQPHKSERSLSNHSSSLIALLFKRRTYQVFLSLLRSKPPLAVMLHQAPPIGEEGDTAALISTVRGFTKALILIIATFICASLYGNNLFSTFYFVILVTVIITLSRILSIAALARLQDVFQLTVVEYENAAERRGLLRLLAAMPGVVVTKNRHQLRYTAGYNMDMHRCEEWTERELVFLLKAAVSPVQKPTKTFPKFLHRFGWINTLAFPVGTASTIAATAILWSFWAWGNKDTIDYNNSWYPFVSAGRGPIAVTICSAIIRVLIGAQTLTCCFMIASLALEFRQVRDEDVEEMTIFQRRNSGMFNLILPFFLGFVRSRKFAVFAIVVGMCFLTLAQQMTSTILLWDFDSVFLRGSKNVTSNAASYSYRQNTLDVAIHPFDYPTSLLDSRHLCFPPQLKEVNATHLGRNLTLAGTFGSPPDEMMEKYLKQVKGRST